MSSNKREDLGTQNIPCRANPDLWWSDNADELGQAKHICLSHCRSFFKCQQIETPLISGLRAGILWNSLGGHSGFQPVEMICNDCVDEGVKRCKHCGHPLKGKQRKYCSDDCSAVISGRKQAVREARKNQLPEPYVIVEA